MRSLYLFILRTLIVLPTAVAVLLLLAGPVPLLDKLVGLALCFAAMIWAVHMLGQMRQICAEQIDQRETLLAEAEQLAHFGSWEWNIRSNNVTWSSNLKRIYALPVEMSGATYESFLEFVHPKDRARVKDEFERACKNRTTFEIYHRITDADGEERILYARGKAISNQIGQPVRLVATAQDVTQWKRAEESLGRAHAESEAKVQQRTAELLAVNDRLRQEIAQRRRAEDDLRTRARQQSLAAQLGVQALQDGDLLRLIEHASSTVAQAMNVDYCEILALQSPGSSQTWAEIAVATAHGPFCNVAATSKAPLRVSLASAATGNIAPAPDPELFQSGVGIFIESGNQRFGALCAYSARQRIFTDDDISFLTSIANVIATAIERSHSSAARIRLVALLDATPDLVATSEPNLQLCDLNPAGRKILGTDADQSPLEHSLLDFHPSWARKLILNEALPQAIQEGLWSGETAVVAADGREIPVYQVIITHSNEAGEIEFIGTIMRDLSERKFLEREIISATEREQQRIGQDLHDDLCQFLTGVSFRTKTLEHRIADDHPREAIIAIEIEEMLEQAIVRAHDLAHGLQPVIMEVGGLRSALEELAINTGRVFNVLCTLEAELSTSIADKVVATHLYRIAQEATRNAIVHGKAKNIVIRLDPGDDHTSLVVEDDGVGMRRDPSVGRGWAFKS